MNKSQIPDVLKPITRTTMSNVDIYTSVLEPVNKSQNRVIFNIRKQGILNAGSRLNLSLHPVNATAQTTFLPLSAGIGELVFLRRQKILVIIIWHEEAFILINKNKILIWY